MSISSTTTASLVGGAVERVKLDEVQKIKNAKTQSSIMVKRLAPQFVSQRLKP